MGGFGWPEILIILVMVVGVQAKDAWIEAADPIAAESTFASSPAAIISWSG